MPKRNSGSNIKTSVTISLEEVLTGCKKEIEFDRPQVCNECSGLGGHQTICPACQGLGYRDVSNRGNLRTVTMCHVCHGRKTAIVDQCEHCHGTGFSDTEKEKIKISIPTGVEDG